jgi:hypothetical protein
VPGRIHFQEQVPCAQTFFPAPKGATTQSAMFEVNPLLLLFLQGMLIGLAIPPSGLRAAPGVSFQGIAIPTQEASHARKKSFAPYRLPY